MKETQGMFFFYIWWRIEDNKKNRKETICFIYQIILLLVDQDIIDIMKQMKITLEDWINYVKYSLAVMLMPYKYGGLLWNKHEHIQIFELRQSKLDIWNPLDLFK